jgi:mono/diheme cytochrome c family protein
MSHLLIRSRIVLAIAAIGLGCAVSPADDTERVVPEDWVEPGEDPGQRVEEGGRLFRQYCASCHGVWGDGRGPVAVVLREQPTDLTRLGERYGTPLPKAQLMRFIDGRERVRAHGEADMPVWGKRLYEDVPRTSALEPRKRGTMLLMLEYLEAIQKP